MQSVGPVILQKHNMLREVLGPALQGATLSKHMHYASGYALAELIMQGMHT